MGSDAAVAGSFQRCRAFPWNCDVVPTLSAKLLSFFQDVQKNVYLKLEVAAMVDWGQHFMYTRESDGPLGLNCFEIINTVRSAIHAAYCPIVQAVVRKLEGKIHGVCQPQLFRYAQGCNQPGLDHFHARESTYNFKGCFSSIQLWLPVFFCNPRLQILTVLCAFFTEEHIKPSKEELPVCLSVLTQIRTSVHWNESRMLQLYPIEPWQLLKPCLCNLSLLLLNEHSPCWKHPLMSNKTLCCNIT